MLSRAFKSFPSLVVSRFVSSHQHWEPQIHHEKSIIFLYKAYTQVSGAASLRWHSLEFEPILQLFKKAMQQLATSLASAERGNGQLTLSAGWTSLT